MTATVFFFFVNMYQSIPWQIVLKRDVSVQTEDKGPINFSCLDFSMLFFLFFFFICQGFDLELTIDGDTLFKKHITSE